MRAAGIFVLLFITSPAFAQQSRTGSWNGLTFGYEPSKKWSIQFGQTVRWYTSPAFPPQFLTDIGLQREITKQLSGGIGYRFTVRPAAADRHRINFDVAYQYRKKKFQITNRARYEFEIDKQSQTHYVRDKLTLKYRKPKTITPALAIEGFYSLQPAARFVDQYRTFAGFDYKVQKNVSATIQWVRTKEIQVRNPLTTDVVLVELTVKLK